MRVFCVWESCPASYQAHASSRSVYGTQDKLSPISPHPVVPAHPTHSLIELRGPVQCLADIRWQVPGVLCSIPGELFALGMVHISNVVECSRLPDLWAAVR